MLLFHAGVPGVPGGYVGVDVFFVLTGFLITSLLAKEAAEGRVRFARFYLRRFRRLLPALVTVLAATLFAGWFVLLPDDLLALTDFTRFAMASVGNFWAWLYTGGYFDASIEEVPLLHTWSLGVEEQFYLLWPATVLLAWRWLSERGRAVALVVALAAGLAYSQYAAVVTPDAAYFLLPARAFEILLGALVSQHIARLPPGWRRGRRAFAVLGLLLVLIPAAVLTGESTFPGFNALWPCLGTALLILTGAGPTPDAMNRALGWRPLVAIGLWSYSIYLWHWPLIALLNYRGVAIVGATRVVVLVLPIALAALTYVLVERPFRYRWTWGFRTTFLVLVLLPVLLAFGVHELVRRADGFPGRFPAAAEALRRDDAKAAAGECAYDRDLSRMPACRIGTREDRIDGLMVGDSYAGMYTNFLDLLAKDAGLSLRHRWFRVSPPIPGTTAGKRPSRKQLAYIDGRAELTDDYEYAVLISAWGNYRYSPRSAARLWSASGEDVSDEADDLQLAYIGELVERGVKVILLDRPPARPGKERMVEYRAALMAGEDLAGVRVPRAERGDDYILDRVRERYPEVLIIDPFAPLCDEQGCGVEVNGTLLYRDDGSHLTHPGSEALGHLFLEAMENPLRR